jgi:hypothetical protein
MKRKNKMQVNVTASVYDGVLDTAFDCIGEDKCGYAEYYTQPPEPGAECAAKHNTNCFSSRAQQATLADLRDRLNVLLQEER